ncbi:hypothetical protein HDV57DRAFT_513607 [Trichoderma longibrachiatum]
MDKVKSALPTHLMPNTEDNGFEQRHHGKTRSHMASDPFSRSLIHWLRQCLQSMAEGNVRSCREDSMAVNGRQSVLASCVVHLPPAGDVFVA